MAKAIKKTEDQTVTSNQEQVFNSVAFSIVNENGKRKLVQVPLNTETLETGKAEVINEGLDRNEVQSEFKLAIIRAGLFN